MVLHLSHQFGGLNEVLLQQLCQLPFGSGIDPPRLKMRNRHQPIGSCRWQVEQISPFTVSRGDITAQRPQFCLSLFHIAGVVLGMEPLHRKFVGSGHLQW